MLKFTQIEPKFKFYLKSWEVTLGDKAIIGYIHKQRQEEYRKVGEVSAIPNGYKIIFRFEFNLSIFPIVWQKKGPHIITNDYKESYKEAKDFFITQFFKQLKYIVKEVEKEAVDLKNKGLLKK